jgi:Protein of unknown function (DUF551).
MNKQEIEKTINLLKVEKANVTFKTDSRIPLYDLAISALQHQLTGGWIPVEKNNPHISGCYQVTIFRKFGNAYFVRCAVFDGNEWFYENGDDLCGKVTAWMPLPDPYIQEK